MKKPTKRVRSEVASIFLLQHKNGHFVPPIDDDSSVLAYLSREDARRGLDHQTHTYDVEAKIVELEVRITPLGRGRK